MESLEICSDFSKKDIVLYGEHEEIIQFLNKYCGLLKISTVVTEYNNDVRLQLYSNWNIKTVLFDNMNFLDSQMIVICSKNKFNTLRRRLEYIGKKEYKDFISCELTEHLLYQKKVIVCMGTQLIGQVSLLMKNHKSLTDKYSIIFFKEEELRGPYRYRFQEYLHVSRCCTVYVRSDCDKENFSLKILDRGMLNENCTIITIADYGFRGYYPQIIEKRERVSEYLLRGYQRLPMDYKTLAFSRTDREMLKFCKENMAVDEIVEHLISDNLYSQDEIIKHFFNEAERFKQLECSADIKLSSFIKENREAYICRNLDEWNEPVVSYVTNSILERLNMPALSAHNEIRKTILEENSGSEIPVYPCVQKALNLCGVLSNKKYRVVTYYSIRYMSLEEYLHVIADYLYKAIDIMKYSGMDEDRIFRPDEKQN